MNLSLKNGKLAIIYSYNVTVIVLYSYIKLSTYYRLKMKLLITLINYNTLEYNTKT